MAASEVFEEIDLDLIAALQHAPRAPFDALARVLGSSASTIARRYGRLVERGAVRLICEVDWSLLAEGVPVDVWLRTEPGRVAEVARALAERADTTYVAICSGRGDVLCTVHARTRADTTRALTVEIPQLPGVRSARTDWVLRRLTSSSAWRLPRLSAEQLARLEPHAVRSSTRASHQLGALERETAAVLRTDARMPFSELARVLGVTESRARRTALAMFESGLLRPRVEVEPRDLGYHIEARASISCRPRVVDRVAGSLLDHPATRFLGLTGSSAMLTFDGVFPDESALADFLVTDLGAHPDITAIECSPQLQILKRYWVTRDQG